MALVVKDRVKETTATTGTGTVTLDGAATGFQAFSAIGDGNTTYYAIIDSATGDWEVGLGTYTASGTTLSRDTILESSNTGSAVNFAAGVKSVFATYPAEKSVFTDDLPTAVSDLTNDSGYITDYTVTQGDVTAHQAALSITESQISDLGSYLTGNQTITLSGDVSGSGTTSIAVTVADDSHNHVISNVDGLQTALDAKLEANQTITLSGDATGSGTTAITVALSANSVGASEIVDNSVGAAELNVTGNGTTSQFLRSDGDGTFTWATPTDTNTTYSAGTGLSLSGTTFTNTAPDQTVTLTGSGATSVSGTYPNFTISSTDTDTNTTYSAGSGLSLSGTTFSHTDTSSQGSVNNSGATVIQDVTLDTYGHVTGLASTTLTAATIGAQPSGTYNTIIGTDSDINTSGSTIIDNIYVTDGVITSMGTRTLTAGDIGAISGSTSQLADKWVNFNGTGSVSIRSQYGVSSITDQGTGKYRVNWNGSFANGNYAAVACSGKGDSYDDSNGNETCGNASESNLQTSSYTYIRTGYSTAGLRDTNIISCVAFG